MRTLIKTLMLAVVALALGGCMQHNGNIGDWFGTWKVETIAVDGTEEADYSGNLFFQFQTDIVRMVEVGAYQSYADRFGSWEDEGSTLVLDFTYKADFSGSFIPLPASHLDRARNLLHIDSKTSRHMQWTLDKPDGTTITYTLKKQ